MIKKIYKLFYTKCILNYAIVFIVAGSISLMYILNIAEYSIRTFIPLTFILVISLFLDIAIQVFACFIILKILGLNVNIKKLHNQIIPFITLRLVAGALIYALVYEYTTISGIINNVIDVCYIILLIYSIKRRYDMGIKQTLIFSVIQIGVRVVTSHLM